MEMKEDRSRVKKKGDIDSKRARGSSMVEGRIRLWVINQQYVDGLWKIGVDKKGRKSARRNMREVLSDGLRSADEMDHESISHSNIAH
ncbi:Uncharacterized protein TCM_045170 [Theobroma cacao]|uniref:Uncharacterized protein n=1 Tax=Theobroma cacao TaxID=3641 RepID=A0A061FR84_THECC|nr:Uncharacterized protein TCM_045170 [Theobroma cacao]